MAGFSLRERWDAIDQAKLAFAVTGFLLVLAIALPRFYPAARRGPTCSDLAAPIGGNNRSLLAQAGHDQQKLDLNLSLDRDTIHTGDPLKISLTFVNNDIGPEILYISPDAPVFSANQPTASINFEIRDLRDNALVLPTDWTAMPTAFDSDTLHLLGSRGRCTQSFQLDPVSMPLPPGEYRIKAVYRNRDAGTTATQVPGATATPAYPNRTPIDPYTANIQGVWTGEVRSQEIRFTVLPPPSPTFIPMQ